jgi:hypothetical protein
LAALRRLDAAAALDLLGALAAAGLANAADPTQRRLLADAAAARFTRPTAAPVALPPAPAPRAAAGGGGPGLSPQASAAASGAGPGLCGSVYV